jgi:beta-glucosidase
MTNETAVSAPAGFHAAAPASPGYGQRREFPAGFVWGAATAAYQIEGAVAEDGRGTSIWDTFSHTPGRVMHDDTGDTATDHYHRVSEDLDLMKDLGLGSYRFSVAWPRVQPDGQTVNHKGLDFYRRLVDGLLERGIQPALTLYHWDLPQALDDLGGWLSRDTAGRFADYADVVAGALGDRVRMWMTLNEPWVASWLGYGAGRHAPGLTDLRSAATAQHHLLLAHGQGLAALRSRLGADRQVGIVLSMASVYPASQHPDDVAAAAIVDAQFNRSCADPLFKGCYRADLGIFSNVWSAEDGPCRPGDLGVISAPIDFLGVNSYFTRTVAAPGRLDALGAVGLASSGGPMMSFGMDVADVVPSGQEVTAMGWPVNPRGMRDLLLALDREYQVPLYITENGASYHDYPDPRGDVRDPERVAYLDRYLGMVHEAIAQGADVKGYFVWSLLDNFEWGAGYSQRFGLIYVDYPTSRRIPKTSYHWYRELVRSNCLAAAD